MFRKIKRKYQKIIHSIKNLQYWFKIIVQDQPWDYEFLLDIEHHKLQSMSKYFDKSRIVVDWERMVRDINICIRLLEIIKEDDWFYKDVNVKNAKRFVKEVSPDALGLLRVQKAWYLYNYIRYHRLQQWWD